MIERREENTRAELDSVADSGSINGYQRIEGEGLDYILEVDHGELYCFEEEDLEVAGVYLDSKSCEARRQVKAVIEELEEELELSISEETDEYLNCSSTRDVLERF